jgi:adenine-specific DNA-methyltransferase
LTRLADIFNQNVNDIGFRKLELRESNFTSWRSTVKDVNELQVNLDLSIDNVDPTATQLDLLFEIVSKAGFLLSEQITKTIISQKTVYSISQGALLICLEEQLTAELIDAVIEKEPTQFICLDKGFQGNDQLKANTAQAFKARSQDSEAEMVFKVV